MVAIIALTALSSKEAQTWSLASSTLFNSAKYKSQISLALNEAPLVYLLIFKKI
jgi:hypothetical protein